MELSQWVSILEALQPYGIGGLFMIVVLVMYLRGQRQGEKLHNTSMKAVDRMAEATEHQAVATYDTAVAITQMRSAVENNTRTTERLHDYIVRVNGGRR
ncbi:hypothetical protein IIA79_01360 [bacterium]|nr:hypothetical protein [bacterium]